MARGVKWKNPPGSAARSRNKETKPQTHLALSSEVGPKAPRLRNGLCPPMGMVRPCSGPPAGEGCKAEKTRKRVIAHSSARTQLPTSPSPTTRRCSLLINSLLCTSAAFISAVICFKVLGCQLQLRSRIRLPANCRLARHKIQRAIGSQLFKRASAFDLAAKAIIADQSSGALFLMNFVMKIVASTSASASCALA